MKNFKKIAGVLLALVMVFALTVTAFAQTVESGQGGSSTITINNASKDVTYDVYKIFDATFDENTKSIAYTYNGTLPENDYFQQDAATGAITATDASKDEVGNLNADATKWVQDTLKEERIKVTSAVANGDTPLTFTGLQYGYYLVTSTHGALVAVNSAAPNAIMDDKNFNVPSWDPEDPHGGKSIVTGTETTADSTEANIGDIVTFRLSIFTQNFTEENKNPIAHYIIGDTLPEGQDFIEITGVKVVEGDKEKPVTDYVSTDDKFPITVNWLDASAKSLYNAGATLVIEYTAKLNDKAVIDGDGNVNTATFTYDYYNPEIPDNPTRSEKTETDTATVYAYALGFKKVNEKGEALAGAQFQLPFYVKETKAEDGAYIYAGEASGAGLTNQLTTGGDGMIVIKGVKEGSYKFTETKAPVGYNKLDGEFTVPVAKTGSSTTTTTITKYLDENGKVTNTVTETTVTYEAGEIAITDLGVVVNKTGSLLPGTGGIGTTIFYVVGGILLVGAAVLLITKKRMSAAKESE